MSIADKLREKGAKKPSPNREPLWEGPNGEGDNGGITYSLIKRWLVCRERFRIQVVDGLTPAPSFNPVMDYGNMWHICEEEYAKSANSLWLSKLQVYCRELCQKYTTQQPQITHWYEICKAQFPIYIDHWKKFDHSGEREPLLQEHRFDIHYTLPSGNKVRLRGKWDSVDLLKDRIWLQENKTKSSIDVVKLSRQLLKDLQSMLYLVTLSEYKSDSFWNRRHKRWRDIPLAGVRYNVIRRSAHKSVESMLEKIGTDRRNGRIREWFERFETRVADKDIKEFQRRTLHPILETICEWWKWISSDEGRKDPFANPIHFESPLGVRNVLLEGGETDLDFFVQTGSQVGLVRAETLFPELQL